MPNLRTSAEKNSSILSLMVAICVGRPNIGLPWWLRGHRVHLQCRRPILIPEFGRSPGGGNGNPLQYSCLESVGLQRLGHDWVTKHTHEPKMTRYFTFFNKSWRLQLVCAIYFYTLKNNSKYEKENIPWAKFRIVCQMKHVSHLQNLCNSVMTLFPNLFR